MTRLTLPTGRRRRWRWRRRNGAPNLRVVRRGDDRYRSMIRQQRVSLSELTEAMRREACANIADVRVANLKMRARSQSSNAPQLSADACCDFLRFANTIGGEISSG